MNTKSSAEQEPCVRELSTSPGAHMKLFLRFNTPEGPRTVIAPNVPLLVAAEIADAMSQMGQHAEYVDQFASLSIAGQVELRHFQRKNRSKRDRENVVVLSNKVAGAHP